MDDARRPARGGSERDKPWRVPLMVGGALLAVVLVRLGVERDADTVVSGPPRQATATVVPTDDLPIIYAGTGSQTTEPFYLAGGTYRSHWAAWGNAPEYPPCTHSAELRAIDPANATASGGYVADLARRVSVPATGASAESYVVNLKAGDYYLYVSSACAWQIALSPNSQLGDGRRGRRRGSG
jgi:hypothetical protein